jgi:hypothetical protein
MLGPHFKCHCHAQLTAKVEVGIVGELSQLPSTNLFHHFATGE